MVNVSAQFFLFFGGGILNEASVSHRCSAAMDLAIASCSLSSAEALLNSGDTVDCELQPGESAVQAIVQSYTVLAGTNEVAFSCLEMLSLFLRFGADPNFRKEGTGRTALHDAALRSRNLRMDRVASILRNWGARSDLVDVNGDTPLSISSRYPTTEAEWFLHAAGGCSEGVGIMPDLSSASQAPLGKCTPCPTGSAGVGGRCKPCIGREAASSDSSECLECKANAEPNASHSTCELIPLPIWLVFLIVLGSALGLLCFMVVLFRRAIGRRCLHMGMASGQSWQLLCGLRLGARLVYIDESGADSQVSSRNSPVAIVSERHQVRVKQSVEAVIECLQQPTTFDLQPSIKVGNVRMLQYLLDRIPASQVSQELNSPRSRKPLPLTLAISHHHTEIVQLLLRRGASPGAQDPTLDQQSVLFFALDLVQIQIGGTCTRAGSPGKGRGRDLREHSPLGSPSRQMSPQSSTIVDCALACVHACPELDLIDHTTGDSFLMALIRCRFLEEALYILEEGADFTVVNYRGETALHLAASAICSTLVDALIDRGADMWLKDDSKKTPLFRARTSLEIGRFPENHILAADIALKMDDVLALFEAVEGAWLAGIATNSPATPVRIREATETLVQKLEAQLEDALAEDSITRLEKSIELVKHARVWGLPQANKAALRLVELKLEVGIATKNEQVLKQAIITAKQYNMEQLVSFKVAEDTLKEALLEKEEEKLSLSELNSVCPSHWSLDISKPVKRIEPSPHVVEHLQTLLDATHKKVYTRDRKNDRVPSRLVIKKAVHVQNSLMFQRYTRKREEIASELTRPQPHDPLFVKYNDVRTIMSWKEVADQEVVDMGLNEFYLFHGTTPVASEAITSSDFRISLSGTHSGTLYGRGIYFAECCSKADEYSSEDRSQGPTRGLRSMLVCRVLCGRIKHCDEMYPHTGELVQSVLSKDYHSVLGDREAAKNTFREFVIYDEDQAYPEFLIWYERVFK